MIHGNHSYRGFIASAEAETAMSSVAIRRPPCTGRSHYCTVVTEQYVPLRTDLTCPVAGDRSEIGLKISCACMFRVADDGHYEPGLVCPVRAGAAHAAADLATHRSPSGASRDRGCRDPGHLAGVLPAGARSNHAPRRLRYGHLGRDRPELRPELRLRHQRPGAGHVGGRFRHRYGHLGRDRPEHRLRHQPTGSSGSGTSTSATGPSSGSAAPAPAPAPARSGGPPPPARSPRPSGSGTSSGTAPPRPARAPAPAPAPPRPARAPAPASWPRSRRRPLPPPVRSPRP